MKFSRLLMIFSLGCLMQLVACGGGAPGTGGTGVMAGNNSSPISTTGSPNLLSTGNISGFGSIWVNGVRFNDQLASIVIDGNSQTSADLRLGMIAQVSGSLSTVTSTLGNAERIDVWAIALGTVSQVSSGSFTVAGMSISSNAATVFDSITGTAALKPKDRVKVWGFAKDNHYSSWMATRVELLSADSGFMTSGLMSSNSSLNGYSLTGSVSLPSAGQAITVLGQSGALSITVTLVHGLTMSVASSYTQMEREGVITSQNSPTSFMLAGLNVDASSATVAPSTATWTVGQVVEVEGRWSGSTLFANLIRVKSEAEQQEVEIDSTITAFTSISNFTVRGVRCDASALKTVNGGSLNDLKVGLRIHLHGLKVGDRVKLTELEIIN